MKYTKRKDDFILLIILLALIAFTLWKVKKYVRAEEIETITEYVKTEEIKVGTKIEEKKEVVKIEKKEKVPHKFRIRPEIERNAKKYNVDIDWIIKTSKNNGFNPEFVLETLYTESGMNPKAYRPEHQNKGGGSDRGISQYNSKWKAYVTDECAYNYKCAVNQMMKEWKAGKVKHWYGARIVQKKGIKLNI